MKQSTDPLEETGECVSMAESHGDWGQGLTRHRNEARKVSGATFPGP